jgi:hypothetical protein
MVYFMTEDWDNRVNRFASRGSCQWGNRERWVWRRTASGKARIFSDRPESGPTPSDPRQHSIALMCDDIDATVNELRAKGAQFRGPIEEREYGRVIMMIVPGANDMQLYQPTHKLAYNL